MQRLSFRGVRVFGLLTCFDVPWVRLYTCVHPDGRLAAAPRNKPGSAA
ncbi:MAG: hypothetical protein JXR77_13865 [Lentisphaeria bacterium]|nr:hypothetical protein [Lentisphaeria bacterium]